MDGHVRTATHLLRTELDGQPAVVEVVDGVAHKGKRGRRLANLGRVQSQTGVSDSAFTVGPGKSKITWRQAPNGGVIAGVKASGRTPDVLHNVPCVDEEGVVAAAAAAAAA